LKEHAKALHRVFLDFQSDSVYIALEDSKQKHAQMGKKLEQKAERIIQLNTENSKLKKQVQDVEDQKAALEQSHEEHRRKLRNTIVEVSRLERRVSMQQMEEANKNDQTGKSDLDQIQKRLVDPGLYLQLYQKVIKINNKLADFFQKCQ